MTGRIKFFDNDRGFGFIIPDDGSREMFVHIKSCAEGIDELSEGQRVRYEERTSPRTGKPEAYDLELV